LREGTLPLADDTLLRRTFAIASEARARGDHPFGAILVGPNGAILMEQGNCFASDGNDRTAHAERLLATRVSKTFDAAFLALCSLYSSAEPCAMCAGAIYWAGIGRVVFGLSEKRLAMMTGSHGENPTLDLPCRIVFAAGRRDVTVAGPLLEDEAAVVHQGFWDRRGAP
jgi:tRNA(Arg) A34 adenosine deaminase TadA